MDYLIQNYGAIGDGETNNAEAIQAAIDACSAAGGGRVIVSGGTFLTGTIVLKDNVDLHIAQSGKILGSPNCGEYEEVEDKTVRRDLWGKVKDYGDYPDFDKKHVDKNLVPRFRGSALIVADEVKNVSITGEGTIDANGEKFMEIVTDGTGYTWTSVRRIDAPTPPRVVFFTGCTNVTVKDITMVNQPAGWSYWVHDCDYVSFDRIKVIARVDYPNNDGIHINCSRNVTVSNSSITCGDDSIVVRANSISLKENKVCERVVITNCNLTSNTACIRIGWINDGIIRNCCFSNLVMTDATVGITLFLPDKDHCSPSDIGRESTHIENLSFSNIIMDNTFSSPIIMQPTDHPDTKISKIGDLYFSDIHAKAYRLPYLVGTKDHPLENIRFSNCDFEVLEPSEEDLKKHRCKTQKGIPADPVFHMKHIKGLSISNTNFKLY